MPKAEPTHPDFQEFERLFMGKNWTLQEIFRWGLVTEGTRFKIQELIMTSDTQLNTSVPDSVILFLLLLGENELRTAILPRSVLPEKWKTKPNQHEEFKFIYDDTGRIKISPA